MRNISFIIKNNLYGVLFVIGFQMSNSPSYAQQLKISDFTIFSGSTVTIGSSNTINGGSVGSNTLVQSTGIATINANVYSGGKVTLANSNIISGKITAANSASLTGTILSVGSNANLKGNIDVNGKIVIASGIVSGIVTHPPPATNYSGPAIGVRNVSGTPTFPALPQMPAITSFPAFGSADVTSTKAIAPGAYRDIALGGNNTLTLSGPGVYVFKSFTSSGPNSQVVFDFKNTTTGNFSIYVYGDVVLNKMSASMINGGDATRIYSETHGTGSTDKNDKTVAWNMSNGSNGQGNVAIWLGSIWAPYAAIKIGSPNGPSSMVTGALWSGTQINIPGNATINYAPSSFCTAPNANAGPDKPLDFSPQTILTGSSTTPDVSYSWQAIDGGIITSPANAASITVSVSGGYVLTVSTAANCFARDTVFVSSRLKSVIGSELQSIYDNHPTSSPFFIISNDSVIIDVIANEGYYNTVLSLLQTPAYGLTNILPNGASNFIITGKFPRINLPKLNLLFNEINFCRPYYQALKNIGLVTSAGDTAMRSYLVRKGYKVNGDGIKVGVISDSYATITAATTATLPLQPVPGPIPQTFITNTAAQDISNGDLPGDTTFAIGGHVVNPNGFNKNVHVLEDFPIKLSDEGRAMSEIVHDVASGAEIYFRTGFFTANDCALGIKELKDAGCKVIVDDITYITEPVFKDGVIANAVDAVANQGVAYFSAAGNFADRAYEKNFNPIPVPSGPFAGKMAHNFVGSDMFQHVRLAPGDYTIVFQWVDDIYSFGETTGTRFDLDGYLTPNTDGTSLFGYNRDNTGGDPIEFIPFTIPPGSDSVDANIFIINNTPGGNPSRIKYIVFRGGMRIMEYNEGTSTITGQANALGAIAVGAARFDKVPPYLNPPLIESFSSIGGTQTNGTVRNKPDFVAPDGGNTTVKLGQDYPNTALDGYSNFFGTSAAAPHAAAVAALIMEGRKKFLGQAVTTPSEIRSLMQSTAIDMAAPGFDFISGYGFVNVDLAMRTFAAPTPSIDQLVIPVTSPITIPGNSVFTVTVKGDNFSTNSIIYYNDSALASTVILNTNEATAVMPVFEDNPEIRMYTPPYPNTIIVNGEHLDGGFSNSLHFFDADITVSAVNASKKFGQQLPVLDTIIKINGVLLQDTTLTLADLGLSSMTVTTAAGTYSDVGTYIITPSRIFDENNPADIALLQKFHYTFPPGALTVEKMPLKVTPEDKIVTYGQYIGNVTFKYEFDHTNVPDPDSVLSLIKNHHQGYVPNNALAVIKDFSKTQANGSTLTTADLLNLNMIASFKAVKNSRKFQVENNELVPLSNQNTFNVQYLLDVASESIYNYITSPGQAPFFNGYPGINSKAILGAESLNNNTANVEINGSLVKIVNGSLEQMVNTLAGPMVPILNGSFVQIINGELYPVSDGSLVQLANGSLVKIVNGEFAPLANGSLVKLVNGSLVKIVNGSLVQLIDGVETPIITNVTDISAIPNGSLVKIVNGSLVKMVNGSLVKIVNGSLEQILNGSLVKIVNGSLVKIVNGSTLGLDGSSTTNNTAVILDQSDVDPLQSNWLGAMFGINMITGLDVGTQWLIPGVLVNSNFDITYGLGKVTINKNPCLITHSLDKSFGSSSNPGTPTSLWLSVVTKVSGQLKSKGDYLLFKTGAVTFNNINSTPAVSNFPLPNGKIVADNVSVPFAKYDAASDTWITKVPIGFSSTSDIFVTGAIITSSTGFVKNNNGSTSVKGIFYSNKNFKDQWAYQSAAYQPTFNYASIADSGIVTSINGTYRAGTPTSQITNLVNGGSGGGGNNYSGSTNSFDKFTACVITGSAAANRPISLNEEERQDISLQGGIQIIPNPATNYISLSFVPSTTGSYKIALFTIDGKKVFETNNGICQAGIKYQKKIDVSKLINGLYLVQLKSNDKITIKKIIVGR